MTLRIGTRGSALARAQTSDVARLLAAQGHSVETVVITTSGDRVTDRAFSDVGAFGIFVRELESALLDRRIDVAVHSYKDLPSRGSDGLAVVAVPERVDPADVLVVRRDSLYERGGAIPLREGARVGTSAMRRQSLLKHVRPDLEIGMLRGNVPTRIRALDEGKFDAIVLAAAGLARLERSGGLDLSLATRMMRVRLDPAVFVPAPTQGAIAVQVRDEAGDVRDAVARIDDPTHSRTVRAERAALSLAESGCTVPFGAWCSADAAGMLTLHTCLGGDDGSLARAVARGTDPDAVAAEAWKDLSVGVRA